MSSDKSKIEEFSQCRVRFDMKDGRAGFAYSMHLRTEIEQTAFRDVVEIVTDRVAAKAAIVLAGKPG